MVIEYLADLSEALLDKTDWWEHGQHVVAAQVTDQLIISHSR